MDFASLLKESLNTQLSVIEQIKKKFAKLQEENDISIQTEVLKKIFANLTPDEAKTLFQYIDHWVDNYTFVLKIPDHAAILCSRSLRNYSEFRVFYVTKRGTYVKVSYHQDLGEVLSSAERYYKSYPKWYAKHGVKTIWKRIES